MKHRKTSAQRGTEGNFPALNSVQRMTLPRYAIFQLLRETCEHLSAEEILQRLKGRYPKIGMATVYRTLELLKNSGLLVTLDAGDGRVRYELAEKLCGDKHHHHLICKVCHKIVDFQDFAQEETSLMDKAAAYLAQKYGFHILSHDLSFYGLCLSCQQPTKKLDSPAILGKD